jgi:hypothetical protein
MSLLPPEAFHWASTHHGTIDVDVLRRLGVSTTRIRRLVTGGVLQRILDGVYRFTGAPVDPLAREVATSSRKIGMLVSGPNAARHWGLRRVGNDGLVHALAPPASHPSVESWLRPFRTSAISERDIVERDDGIRLTSPPRTALDLMRYLPPEDVLSVVDQLEHTGMCSASTMLAVALPVATPGRPWARAFVELLEGRLGGAPPESHWESRVVGELLQRGHRDIEPQYWLDVPGFGRIRMDVAIPALRWGLEIDGHHRHFSESGAARDRERDLACDGVGWVVQRVATMTLDRAFDATMDRIDQSIRRRRSVIGGSVGR